MAITLDSFQEVGWHADNGCLIRTTVPVEASISAIKRYTKDEQGFEHGAGYKVSMIISSIATGETLVVYDREYTTLEKLLDDLGIDEIDEVWEVLDC